MSTFYCLNKKNEDSLTFIFNIVVKLSNPGAFYVSRVSLLRTVQSCALCLCAGLQMRGISRDSVVLLLGQVPVP